MIELEVDYDATAADVWAVLTDRRLAADWWLATDLVAEAGRVARAVPPPDLAGFHGPFTIEVVAVDAERRLAMRWRGRELFSDVTWDLEPRPHGCRLRVTQSGYFGIDGLPHRRELLAAYETFFAERLPLLLADPPQETLRAVPGSWEVRSRRARRDAAAAALLRLRVLSAVAAIVLTAVVITGLTALILQPSMVPAEAGVDPWRTPAFAAQPGESEPVSPTARPSGRVSVRPSRSAAVPTPSRSRISALFRVRESYELGYIGAITVKAGPDGLDGWSAVIVLPPGASVSSAWDQMAVRQQGATITFTPLAAHRVLQANGIFTFEFQVNLPSGVDGTPLTCTVASVPCA
ncbi:uncharacterized protein YndB with AHSA1/START domain [Allocatelliglobosispora scoriae]|uniref:Uncharacterized protein YndB with AHSA1/START domain n=1 Tax=Allocatelliglobosispora scoriae TaxID=643052 RepID=A0A841BL87_9ACTN|nr:SRPBCC domain-containing protein [Allocatelliglobosispora scoriae]MBB5869054.1 uncharacterized protein YndB with AHSA1/START domain [Allocatelliglobosispora scoriae]